MALDERDHVDLDLRHLEAEQMHERFPTITRELAARGLDLATDLIPVAPAAHYFIGGVAASWSCAIWSTPRGRSSPLRTTGGKVAARTTAPISRSPTLPSTVSTHSGQPAVRFAMALAETYATTAR